MNPWLSLQQLSCSGPVLARIEPQDAPPGCGVGHQSPLLMCSISHAPSWLLYFHFIALQEGDQQQSMKWLPVTCLSFRNTTNADKPLRAAKVRCWAAEHPWFAELLGPTPTETVAKLHQSDCLQGALSLSSFTVKASFLTSI